MIWRLLQGRDVQPKYLVSACPKHGLHLAAMMVEAVCNRHPASIYNENHWHGTFQFNSFAPVWREMGRWFFLASRLRQGYYMQGHVGYRQDIETFLDQSRIAHVFMYRDLRDAAVSQAHHILDNDNVRFRHAGKAAYRCGAGSFDEVLSGVITGVGYYPSVADLFGLYAGWLDAPNTYSIRFEDALANPLTTARSIVEFGLERITTDIWETPFKVDLNLLKKKAKAMVDTASQTRRSPTFRKGKAGGWREEFTDEHKKLFKAHGGNEWLVRLGYEQDGEW